MTPFEQGKRSLRRRNRRGNKPARPVLERFEDRLLLASNIFTVTSNLDDASGATLRDAIKAVNAVNSTITVIDFNITGSTVITPTTTPLDAIINPVTIDGTSEPGGHVIQIDGNGLTGDGLILAATATGSVIKGLDIYGFNGSVASAGIFAQSNGNTITDNLLGTDPARGHTVTPNSVGLVIAGADNTIGGLNPSTGNTIAFNTGDGIAISTPAGSGNVVASNAIFQNGNNGIIVDTANGNTFSSNAIYANTGSGIARVNNGNDASTLFPPALTAATSFPGQTQIEGMLTGLTAGTSYTVEYFASVPTDPATGDQAHVFLGTHTYTPAGTTQVLAETLPTTVPLGQTITATVTDGTTGSTSSFAPSVQVASAFIVTNTKDTGIGSLRQVIANADLDFGIDSILFQIKGSGPYIIQPTAPLVITDQVVLDATSQPGFTGTPIVQIEGSGNGNDGLVLGFTMTANSAGSAIRGLDINGFRGGNAAGIHIETNNNTIAGNYIGTDPNGTTATSGNTQGILIDNASNNMIGGGLAARNLISGNTDGVVISGDSAHGNLVQNNFIGTAIDGTSALGNTTDGVLVEAGAQANTIGGATASLGNTIAFNGTGVAVDGTIVTTNSAINDTISTNSIYANTSAAIVLSNNGNLGLAAPVLTNATSFPGETDVAGTAAPNTTYTIQFFSNVKTDPNTPGQAHVFLGAGSITTNGTGQFTTKLISSLAQGVLLSATLTDASGNTSPLSAGRAVTSAFEVINTNNSGIGSLSAAIDNANTNAINNPGSTSTIVFNIPLDANHDPVVITPTTAFDPITGSVIIDATSEPGYNGSPLIEIDGKNLTGDGLVLSTGSTGSTIKGLDLYGFNTPGAAAIHVETAGNTIQNNYLGPVVPSPSASSGDAGNAIGVLIDGTASNHVGGLASVGNLIAKNGIGVEIKGISATGNFVQGNKIGTTVDGTSSLPNTGNGVLITGGASNNLIGGTNNSTDQIAIDLANTINFDQGNGVEVDSGSGNTIRTNSIFIDASATNPGTAISIASGANGGIQPPSLTGATSLVNSTTIQGTFTPPAGTLSGATFTLEFFSNPSGTQNGQGKILIGTKTITSTGVTPIPIALSLPVPTDIGSQISATVTDAAGDTSAFSGFTPVINAFQVNTNADSGVGSLRDAINNALAHPGNTITFNIPLLDFSNGTTVIHLLSPLPVINVQVSIDATSQPGYSGVPMIQLDGSQMTSGFGSGLVLAAGSDHSFIKGLDFTEFTTPSTDPTAPDFSLGKAAALFIASGNDTIQNDDIGTDITGTLANPGNTLGIYVTGAHNTIGGSGPNAGNIIDRNTSDGITLATVSAVANTISGNTINSNNGNGITIVSGSNNTISGNAISGNTGIGVSVDTGTGNTISRNSIEANTGSGIARVNNGNNAGTLNVPVLSGAFSFPGQTQVAGTLTGLTAGNSYTVEYFASAATDPATGDQAHVFLGSHTYIPSGSSQALSETFPTTIALGQTITATVTDTTPNSIPIDPTRNSTSSFAIAVPVANSFVVTNTNASGPGSLSQVIANANANAGLNPILFQIPGSGVHIIQLSSPLLITNSIVLDATSQPGFAGTPLIELEGSGNGNDGLVLGFTANTSSAGSTIRGFDIVGFSGGTAAGIHIETSNNIIAGNFIGTNPNGTSAGASNTLGILIDNVSNNIVGGTSTARNLISGNTDGVVISGDSAHGNLVQNNFIGTAIDGSSALGNTTDGVLVEAGAQANTIGGATASLGNTIAFNGTGVAVDGTIVTTNSAVNDTISTNSIYANTSAAIVLSNNGNLGLAAPVLTNATSFVGETDVTGTAAPNTTYTIQFFSNVKTDPNTPGQAHVFVATTTITTNGTGHFTTKLTSSLAQGVLLSATLTDATGNTSPLSAGRAVSSAFEVSNTNNSGIGSLSAAIDNANTNAINNPGTTSTIFFSIPLDSNNDPVVITPTTAFDLITGPVIIDATSEPGYNGSPLIEIDGKNLTGDGLVLSTGSAGSTIKGLDLYGFNTPGAAAIHVKTAGNTIQNNYLGPVVLSPSASSGDAGNAIGVLIDGTANNLVGGLTATGNLIAAYGVGVEIKGSSATGNLVQGNLISPSAAGALALANTTAGVLITGGASNNLIGGTNNTTNQIATIFANTINFDQGNGVEVDSGAGNTIRTNSIFVNASAPNAGTAILIASGANAGILPPTLTGATSLNNTTTVEGTFIPPVGTPVGATFTLEFFSNPAGATNGEGKVLIGTQTFPATGIPAPKFSYVLPLATDIGSQISVTVTDAAGDTSAFSGFTPVLNAFLVNNNDDSGVGSLRDAINNANASSGPVQIVFNIPAIDFTSGTTVIHLMTPLPAITNQVTIDASTQPGYSGAPIIQLDGSQMISGFGSGLVLATGSDHSLIKGLDFTEFTTPSTDPTALDFSLGKAAAIFIASGNDTIQNDDIGTDITNLLANPGNTLGIYVTGAHNTIGGSDPNAGNIIGRNTSDGITLATVLAVGNTISGNTINSNIGNGITIASASNTVNNNTIDSNTGNGIAITSVSATGNTISNNTINGNSDRGITIGSASNSVIANTITGNASNGIAIGNDNTGNTFSGNTLSSNLIFANGASGIAENPATFPAPTLSAATSFSGHTQVEGTLTGLTKGETFTVEYFASGLENPLDPTAQANILLGSQTYSATGATQFLSDFFTNTLTLFHQTITATVTYTTTGSTSAFAGPVTVTDPFSVTTNLLDSGIGSLRQVIENANTQAQDFRKANPNTTVPQQVITFDIPAPPAVLSTPNVPPNPTVPPDPNNLPIVIAPSSPLDALTAPVYLEGLSESGASGQLVIQISGADIPSGDGLILAPGSDGSKIEGLIIDGFAGGAGMHVESNGNTIVDNILGTNQAGAGTLPGNSIGLQIDKGSKNTIGGTGKNQGNVISGNASSGIQVQNAAATGNLIEGNFIGTDSINQTANLGNSGSGVLFTANASNNTVGGTQIGAGNFIFNNQNSGVFVLSGAGNLIQGDTFNNNNGLNGKGLDINLGTVGNIDPASKNPQAAPSLVASTYDATLNQTFVTVDVFGKPGDTVQVDFYMSDSSGSNPQERTFLPTVTQAQSPLFFQPPSSAQPLSPAPFVNSSGPLLFTIPGSGTGLVTTRVTFWAVANMNLTEDNLSATETVVANGTSEFSSPLSVASEFTVTNTLDSAPGQAAPLGSLRAAIEHANANGGPATIVFNIPGPVPVGSFTNAEGDILDGFVIPLQSPLVLTASNITIDATTENVFLNPTDPSSGVLVDVDGSFLKSGGSSLVVTGGSNDLRGLAFTTNHDPNNADVQLEGPGGNTLEGDYFGIETNGEEYTHNANGIIIDHSNGNHIGTATYAEIIQGPDGQFDVTRNYDGEVVVSGNDGFGIQIINGAQQNVIQNAFIGTDPTGTFSNGDLANRGNGVDIENAPNNTVGGAASGLRNVISGNFLNGILIHGSGTSGNLIVNNNIGIDVTGTLGNVNLGNSLDGILVLDASNTTIGGPNGLNLISGNYQNGIHILSDGLDTVATGNKVFNNFIGTDITGTVSDANIGNSVNGIVIENSTGNTIGGTSVNTSGNLISGNLKAGILLTTSTSTWLSPTSPLNTINRNIVLGNKIGTTASGNSDLGNGSDGIDIIQSASNTIGGTDPNAGNLITGNNGNGVLITGQSAQNNVLMGNIIGAKTTTSQTAGNAFNGVAITSAVNNTIGGTTAGAGNTIDGDGFGSFERSQLSTSRVRQQRGNQIVTSDSYVAIATGSFTRAGNADLVVVDTQVESDGTKQTILRVLEQDVTGTYVPITDPAYSLTNGNQADLGPFFLTTGHFLNDTATGLSDLVVVSAGTRNAYILQPQPQPNGDVLFVLKKTISLGPIGTPTALTVGQFSPGSTSGGAVLNDFIIAVKEADTANRKDMSEVLVYQGDGTLLPPAYPVQGTVTGITVNDFNSNVESGPFLADFAVSSYLTGANNTVTGSLVQVFLNQGNNTFFGLAPTAIANEAVSIASGQFNPTTPQNSGDTFADLVVITVVPAANSTDPASSTSPGAALIYEGNGNGTLNSTATSSYKLGLDPVKVVVGNFNGNGFSDIAIVDQASNEVTVLGSIGNGMFSTPTNFDAGTNPTGIVAVTPQGSQSQSIAISNGTIDGNNTNLIRTNLRLLTARNSNGISITDNSTDSTINPASGNVVQGNFIGLDFDGTSARPNAADGILLDGATSNTIGGIPGNGTAPRNVISGNNGNGIRLTGAQPVPGAENQILGNLIGTDATGQTTFDFAGHALGNHQNGILIDGVRAIIGGTVGNTISGNGLNGILTQNTGAANSQIIGNTIGLNVDGNLAFSNNGGFNLGNSLDGILINDVPGVTIGGTTASTRNVISGNLGRGIDIRGVSGENLATRILSNLVGTDRTGMLANDALGRSLGNFGDGIFINNASGTTIEGDAPGVQFVPSVISNNRGFGIHVVNTSGSMIGLAIINNFIGTDATGTNILASHDPNNPTNRTDPIGNSSDGVFLDSINGGPGDNARIIGNVIAGNRSNGIQLLQSNHVLITGNHIGTGVTGNEKNLGNAASGILLNESGDNQIGGNSPQTRNIISGNLANGVTISGLVGQETTQTDDDSFAAHNVVSGNYIGLNAAGNSKLANTFSGVFITGAVNNMIGGTNDPGQVDLGNVVSGNAGSGILIGNSANNNAILGNLIGTDRTGLSGIDVGDGSSLGNTADGITLVNVIGTQIGTPDSDQRNVISGNSADGVRIFGDGSTGNVVLNNFIGTALDGKTQLANHADGVLLDHSSPNTVGGTEANQGNVISGNLQNGIQILQGSGLDLVQGNKIGTDITGTQDLGNGGNGILINGASTNVIGSSGTFPLGRNVISANQQNGILIFSPAQGVNADNNIVENDYIGTDVTGTQALGNGGNGIYLIDGNGNFLGGYVSPANPQIFNVISANAQNGIQLLSTRPGSATGNTIDGNEIGVGSDGTTRLSNLQNGVYLVNASGNQIGNLGGPVVPGTNVPLLPQNVISGNLQAGVQLFGTSVADSIVGNYIGVARNGAGPLDLYNGNGVFINNTPDNTIGGVLPGAGNIISGSNNTNRPDLVPIGIQLFGPQGSGNVVQGNLIGTDITGQGNYGNAQGIFIDDAPSNTIGGFDPLARNLISRNTEAGIQIFGPGATGNFIINNQIGTDILGDTDVTTPNTIQNTGVLINDAFNNTLYGNLISSNQVGVQVTGKTSTGNNIANNRIGVTATGLGTAPNVYGIFFNAAPSNVVQNNLISANTIAGVQIFGQDSTNNIIIANTIGPDATGGASFTAAGTSGQANGVVIIGAPSNVITGNVVSDNISIGVYITRRDQNNVLYQAPVNNSVLNNQINNNGIYGVLRYDAPNNNVPESGAGKNFFSGNQQNLRDFLSQFDTSSKLPATKSKFTTGSGTKTKAKAKTKVKAASVPLSARPKVPHLFPPGTKPHPIQKGSAKK